MTAQLPGSMEKFMARNANAYNEGLGDTVKPGVADVSKISPDSYTIDQYYLDRPGYDEIQLALFRTYGTNLSLYDSWHSYFRKYQPATLVISGKNDKLFLTVGAEAFKKDIKDAQINLLNGGHFVLEEKHAEAASVIKLFL